MEQASWNFQRQIKGTSKAQHCFQSAFCRLIGGAGLCGVTDHKDLFSECTHSFLERVVGLYTEGEDDGVIAGAGVFAAVLLVDDSVRQNLFDSCIDDPLDTVLLEAGDQEEAGRALCNLPGYLTYTIRDSVSCRFENSKIFWCLEKWKSQNCPPVLRLDCSSFSRSSAIGVKT